MNSNTKLLSFFKQEKKYLLLTAVTGVIYNVGLTAGPLLEGQLAQFLYDILQGHRLAKDLVLLCLLYIVVIAIVQGARALKRLFVRKFANHVSRSMKEAIYRHLLHEPYAKIQQEDTGAMMTRAIADAEACAEGMRKFVTEIFDTGVVMLAYLVMLFVLDWRLSLIVILFPPIAYITSAALKKKVAFTSSQSKLAMSTLNNATVDAAGHALTYRIYGEDDNRSAAYERVLTDYEKKNVAAGIWQNSPQPVYLVISMIGVIPILFLGGRNVLGVGWKLWTIASFTSFLSCFTKLATKSSHAAKLFNAVQKAQVSWLRIEGYLTNEDEGKENSKADTPQTRGLLAMSQVSFSYPGSVFHLHDLSFTARPGEIIGITGKVASGKSTFGKIFLDEYPYTGSIRYDGREIASAYGADSHIFAYAGHDTELFSGTVRENITFEDTCTCRIASDTGGSNAHIIRPTDESNAQTTDSAGSPKDHNTSSTGGSDAQTAASPDKVQAGYLPAADVPIPNPRLQQVLEEVQIAGEVSSETMVGTEGCTLSGGQQARIALARALYSTAPVLILDDPFAAVDQATEEKIFQALRTCENNRIILLISHRIRLFPQMDQVIFLENGTMRAGTHEEMLQHEAYASLYALQTSTELHRMQQSHGSA